MSDSPSPENPMTDRSAGITNPMFRMWLRPDGIIQQVWQPEAAIGLADALATLDAVKTLSGGQRRPVMVDAHATGPLDRPARTEFTRHDDLVSAIALIVNTPLSRMSGNFILAVSKPTPPTRLFDDEASAVAWLSDFAP